VRNWLYSLTPKTRGVVLIVLGLLILGVAAVLIRLVNGPWIFALAVPAYLLARYTAARGMGWIDFADQVDPAPIPRSAIVAIPADASPDQRAAYVAAKLRHDQAQRLRWLVGEAAVMGVLGLGILVDLWLQGPIGLAVTLAFAFLGVALLGLVHLASTALTHRSLHKAEAAAQPRRL